MGVNHSLSKSGWWSNLLDFGQDIFKPRRLSLSLNQLNISNKIGINQSEVSRLENGLVKPRDVPTFNSVCQAYCLTNQEKLAYSRLVYGINPHYQMPESVYEYLSKHVQVIYELNRSGRMSVAIQMSTNLRVFIRGLLESYGLDTRLHHVLGRLVFEESIARWDSDISADGRNKVVELIAASEKDRSQIK